MNFILSFLRLLKFIILNFKRIRLKIFKKKKIVFLDGLRFEEFQELLNLNMNEIEIIDTRLYSPKSRFYFSPQLIVDFLWFFFVHKSNSITYSYICAIIKTVNPKFIIDISKYAFLLNSINHFEKIHYVLFQDAAKAKYKPNIDGSEDYVYSLSRYIKKKNFSKFKNFTIFFNSERDKEIYKDFGITEKNSGIKLEVLGSMNAEFAKEKFKGSKSIYDIVYVSQVQDYTDLRLFGQAKLKSSELIFSFLNSLKKPKIVVLCRNRKGSLDLKKEINYIKNKISHKVKFVFRKEEGSKKTNVLFSYKYIMQSKILITVNSNLGWECLLFNKKPIFAFGEFLKYYRWAPRSINEKKLWKWNLFNKKSSKENLKIYSSLQKLNWKNYVRKNRKHLNYLMPLDSKVKPHIYLKKFFNEI